MIIPSIDLMDGRAVQLRRGREFAMEGGDPFDRLEEFSVAGEVAVVDLDAALGRGSNADLMKEMVKLAACRVGGGIRDLETALDWLDAGATRIVVGTAASVEFCSQFPRERVVAAVDVERGTVVVEGWRTQTGVQVIDRMRELAPVVGGFLLTQVEHEGGMSGFSMELVKEAVEAAGDARLTAAGGITTAEDVADLEGLGADAQVGMALYSGRMTLGAAVAAPLVKGIDNRLWPTVARGRRVTTPGHLLVQVPRRTLEEGRDIGISPGTPPSGPGLRPGRTAFHRSAARLRVLPHWEASLLATTLQPLVFRESDQSPQGRSPRQRGQGLRHRARTG
jgi:phosphoribosylformimino-5-aminoimidazole carboxamide ribonucleotide (ProFAR) isomerase